MSRINRTTSLICGLLLSAFLLPIAAEAGGISFDAGLTPPLDRWIVRTQARYMSRSGESMGMSRKMTMYMFPVVVAYGLRPDLTIMVKQPLISSKMEMGGTSSTDTGSGDLFIMAKYRAYRINTASYTLGIAPTLGIEIPTGPPSHNSRSWDINSGLFCSWRSGLWASDANIAYKWNGVAGDGVGGVMPGDELAMNIALARQFSVGRRGRNSIAPVLELNYFDSQAASHDGHDLPHSGESGLNLSPGLKFTTSSMVLELLVQNPISQSQNGTQLERDTTVILGSRFLF